MATKMVTEEFIASKAIIAYGVKCPIAAHGECAFITYVTAESTNGGKAHKYYWNLHTTDGQLVTNSSPYCGSRNGSRTGHGAFTDKVTCGRCY